MKRVLLCILIILTAVLCFSACGKSDSEPINYVVWLDNAESGLEWSAEIEKQGVVCLLEDKKLNDEASMDGLVFEAVGVGETTVRFYYTEIATNKVKRTVTYLMKVDSQYNITGEKIGDEEAEPLEIKDKNEAEAYLSQNLPSQNQSNEQLTAIYDRTEGKDNEPLYFFDIYETVKKSDGRYFMVYVKTMSVNSVGKIEEYVKEKRPEDIPMSEK